MATIKIAFAGTGYSSKVHAKAALKMQDVELCAVVNHRSESMVEFANKFSIPRQYFQVEDLIEDGDIDALVVSTPNYLHAPQTIAALIAGIPVLVEKPMAMNAKEAKKMLEASQESGAALMVAHCFRFDPEALWLREQASAGKMGKIVRTKGYGVHVNWGPDGWFTQMRFAGGGAMADMGIHALDTARFLLGDPNPVRVYASIGTYYKDFDVDDTGVIFVTWDNGCTSTIESGWWQPHVDGPAAATQLYGDKGFGQIYPTYWMASDDGNGNKIDPGFIYPRDPHCPQSMYDSQLAYFIDCIRSGQTPIPGGLEGLTNMCVVDAAYKSARKGKVVKLS